MVYCLLLVVWFTLNSLIALAKPCEHWFVSLFLKCFAVKFVVFVCSFHMANSYPDLAGEIDVVSDSEVRNIINFCLEFYLLILWLSIFAYGLKCHSFHSARRGYGRRGGKVDVPFFQLPAFSMLIVSALHTPCFETMCMQPFSLGNHIGYIDIISI